MEGIGTGEHFVAKRGCLQTENNGGKLSFQQLLKLRNLVGIIITDGKLTCGSFVVGGLFGDSVALQYEVDIPSKYKLKGAKGAKNSCSDGLFGAGFLD